jgi:hypothetical protein
VTQDIDVSDRLAAVGEHHRDIDEDPSAVVARHEPTPAHRLR